MTISFRLQPPREEVSHARNFAFSYKRGHLLVTFLIVSMTFLVLLLTSASWKELPVLTQQAKFVVPRLAMNASSLATNTSTISSSSSSSSSSSTNNDTLIENDATTEPTQAPVPPPPLPGFAWNEGDRWNHEISAEQQAMFDSIHVEGNRKGGATTCTWQRNDAQVSDECREMLRPVTENVRLSYFMGDSTMAMPFKDSFVFKIENCSTTLKSAVAKGGGVVDYIGIAPEERLSEYKTPVNHSNGEGPTFANLYSPGCSSCTNRLMRFSRLTKKDDKTTTETLAGYVEFLTMEFARDLEYSSTVTDTTQETIARYMSRQRYDVNETRIPNSQTACVISSGMHDLTIPDLKPEVYISNHIATKLLLKEAGCDIWIKFELTAKGLKRPWEQENSVIFGWNQGIRHNMAPDEYQINLFDRSYYSRHMDQLHMDVQSFYSPLMDFFVEMMNVDLSATTTTLRR